MAMTPPLSATMEKISPGRRAIVWGLFFLVCLGIGYPALNRYDPRAVAGLYDTRAYYAMVTGEPLQEDQIDLGHRVLVPYLARPVYWLARGHIKTWDPVFLALLVVNSFFLATTASLLVNLAHRISGNYAAALLAGFIYLANFAVANFNLSGYVDSAVNCLLLAVVWSLLAECWWMLPIWGVAGALAKETFIPLTAVLALAWWITAYRRRTAKASSLVWIGTMVAVGFVTIFITMAHGAAPYSPLGFAESRLAGSSDWFLSGLVRSILAREFLYTFVWLLPLGLFRLGNLPRAWVVGTAWAAAAALAMGAYDDALGNTTRAVFSACGPLLSLSAALLLAGMPKREERTERNVHEKSI